jgi:putative redox protein
MKIELNRLNDGYHLEAINEQGKIVNIDASPDIGGTNQGMRPMQLLLAAMGGCSTIDIINILKKQKQPLRDIKITVTGEREKDAVPSLFVEVHTHFRLYGNLDQDKVQRAVSLSVEKYCSVAKTLSFKANITYSFEILP